MQRRWGACKGSRETLRPETIRNCHAKFMTTGFANDERMSGPPSTGRLAEKVEKMQEMFMRRPKKSIRQAAGKSGLTRRAILSVLHKELSYCPWNSYNEQELKQ